MTFSIIGIDPDDKMIGSAVASKWTGVGGCVQFFRHGVGFVNMQNHSHAQVAHRILDKIEGGEDTEQAIEIALETDATKAARQCIVKSLHSNKFAVYSGAQCTGTFAHKIGKNCAAAGNTIASKAVIDAMIDAYENSANAPITEKLLLALEAGQAAGGDTRGQEAAAIKAYEYTYPQQRFYPIDLRVDHHDTPLVELRKLYDIFGENERRFVV